jgi:hypothetical protein
MDTPTCPSCQERQPRHESRFRLGLCVGLIALGLATAQAVYLVPTLIAERRVEAEERVAYMRRLETDLAWRPITPFELHCLQTTTKSPRDCWPPAHEAWLAAEKAAERDHDGGR